MQYDPAPPTGHGAPVVVMEDEVMARTWRILAVCVMLANAAPAQGQVRRDIEFEPPPKLITPPPPSAEMKNHYDALKLFLQAQRLEKQNRYLEAMKLYEQAMKLDPQAELYKAVIPLCFALDRDQEALELCKKALALDANDFELQFRLAAELQKRGQIAEAADAITKAVNSPAAREHPAQLAQMLFALATLREDMKQYDRAADAYAAVTKILDTPGGIMENAQLLPSKKVLEEAARTYERLGEAEVRARRFDRAIAAFRTAQERDPARAGRLSYNLAQVFIAQQQPDQALAHLQKYLVTQPPGADAYELQVRLLTQLRREREIIPVLEQAVQRDSFNQALRLLLGEQYARMEQPKKAEAIFTAALAEYSSEEAYRGLAKLYQDQGRWEELARRLDKDLADPRTLAAAKPQLQVLAQDPGLTKDVATAARAMMQGGKQLSYHARRVLATLCRQAYHLELAEFFCRKALPDDPQPGDVYLELCRVLAQAHKFDDEAAVCREALTKKLKVPGLLFQLELARALAFAGRDEEALAAATQAVKQTPPGSEEHFQARYTLATVLYRCEKLDQAEAECTAMLEAKLSAGGRRQLEYLLSGVHSARKDYLKAEEYLRKILETDPQDATACNDLGYLWADQGKNLEEAEKLIRKALELDRAAKAKRRGAGESPEAERDHAAYVDSLAWVLFKRGRLLEARELLERAAKLPDGKDPVIWDHLGEVQLKLGRPDLALQAWDEAVKLYESVRRSGLTGRSSELRDRMKELKASTATRR
jgi:tetratricopeptide (TPR) repeat protein